MCANGETIGTAECGSAYPYCDPTTNSCTSSTPTGCTTSFKCTGEGYFPNPTSCELYYFCDAARKATLYKCPAGYAFDVYNSNCKRRGAIRDCVTMKCTTKNSFIANAANAAYYAFCDADLKTTVFKCPGSTTFIPVKLGCEFVCKAAGYYPAAATNQYYFCYYSGYYLVYDLNTCPAGYQYNVSTRTCTKKP